jgi:hypothetical protein
MKREALQKMNRQANEGGRFDTALTMYGGFDTALTI